MSVVTSYVNGRVISNGRMAGISGREYDSFRPSYEATLGGEQPHNLENALILFSPPSIISPFSCQDQQMLTELRSNGNNACSYVATVVHLFLKSLL